MLINGRLIYRHHESGVDNHKIIANMKPGQIIGFAEGDNGLALDCNISIVCASRFAQLIEVDRDAFKKLWKYSKDREVETLSLVVSTFHLPQLLFP